MFVSVGSVGAAIAVLTLPMPGYIKNSIAVMLTWFGACYWVIYWLSLPLDAVSFISRFNLLLLFGIIIVCSIAWHWGRRWKKNK